AIAAVRERHIADAERGVGTQYAKVARDHVAAFDTHQRSNLALFPSFADLGGRDRQDECLWMPANLFADGVNLHQRTLDRFRPGDFAGHPDGKENRGEVALFHPWNVDAAVRIARPEVELAVQNLAQVIVAVAFAHQRFCNLGQLGAVLHARWHRGAIKIRAEADVVSADQFHDVVDMLDDAFPADRRKLARDLHVLL